MLTAYAAVVFDLDGTLVDSYPGITASVNHVRAQHGLPPLSLPEVKKHVGRGMESLLAHTVPDYRPDTDIPSYRQHHPTVMFAGTTLFPGVAETLAGLHRAGKRLGLCSNKPRAFSTQLLRYLGIAERFAIVLGPEDVAQPKPAADMLLTALERLELPANRVLYVGDMTVDIQTARAAGVPVWVVPSGSDPRTVLAAAAPDRILDDLAELVTTP